MSEIFDWARLSEWVAGPCISCTDPAERDSEHTAMGVTRPRYVDPYLEGITGPDEQHEAAGDGHCINPKCRYTFSDLDKAEIERANGEFTCPKCGYSYDYLGAEKNPVYPKDDDQAFELGLTKQRPANPGGMTRSGLTLDEMGNIGEQIVARIGELPDVGAIIFVSGDKHGPIDAIVEGKKGRFGCEIKANHSQAQERFKVGGQRERQAKITYCLVNGLKPALIGVRMNFYTDKAFIFFREGLTDTWIGNAKMLHVATVDFADLNPFKSPDMQAQALAVDNAKLPDQSEEDEFAQAFGAIPKSGAETVNGQTKFTFKNDIYNLKVVDKSGKHTHNVRRCKRCGCLNHIPLEHTSSIECSTCGNDPDQEQRLAKIALASNAADEQAKKAGFGYLGRSPQGHRQYVLEDQHGIKHVVQVGADAYGKHAAEIDLGRAARRMTACPNGQCFHRNSDTLTQVDQPGSPVHRAGSSVNTTEHENYVVEPDDGVALVLTTQTSQHTAASDPAYLYVYYMGELHVEPYDVNVSYERLLSDLMDKFGVDMGNVGMDIDPTKVDAGEIRPRGFSITIEHKQLCEPEVREYAERAVHDWWAKQNDKPWEAIGESPWRTLPSDDLILTT